MLAVRCALIVRLLARSVVLRERLGKDALSSAATALGRTTLRGLALRLLRRLVALRGGEDALLLVRVTTVRGALVVTATAARRCSSMTVRRLLLVLLAFRRSRVLLLATGALVPRLKEWVTGTDIGINLSPSKSKLETRNLRNFKTNCAFKV